MNYRRTTFWKRAQVRAGFVSLVSLLAALSIPLSISPANAAPTGSDPSFSCPGGGSYLVDSSGIAYNGSTCGGNVTLDSSVVQIGANAFESAPLTGLTIPNSVTIINQAAFGYTGLSNLTIPDSVVSIGISAFYGVRLTGLVLGNSLASIGNSAFVSSTLTSLTLPASVTSVGSRAFQNSPLTSLILNSPSITLGSNSFTATAASNLRCFYNFGGATISSATLTSAVLPNPCVTHTITALAGPNGSFSTYYPYIDAGTSPSYVITPAAGFMIDSASVDSTDVTDDLVSVAGQTKSYTFAPVASDHIFSVNFKVIPAPVTPPTPAPTTPPIVIGPTPTPAPEPPVEPKPEATPTPVPVPVPSEAPKPTQLKTTRFSITFFDGGSSSLSKANKTILNKLKATLSKGSKILVTGFSAGPTVLRSDYALSMKRAVATKKHLRTLLDPAARIDVACKQLTAVGGKYRSVQITVWH